MSDSISTTEITFSQAFINSLHEYPDGERFDKCIQCGTCTGICPFGEWMEFAPRHLIASLRAGTLEEYLDSQSVWMCVSCYACAEFCPQEIPLTSVLMTRAKEEAVLAARVPKELQDAFQYTQRYGNPLGEPPRKRMNWVKELPFTVPVFGKDKQSAEFLWFVGDYASYHPRANQAAQAFARILNALEVDYAILGNGEFSDGDSQRLAGERGLFEWLVEKNGRLFQKYDFKTILTTDAHAFNALKNEYPKLGYAYPVLHYTEFLAQRLEGIKARLTKEINARVTYHDACYLGRVNGIYEPPRELLSAIPGVELVEMTHHHNDSLCCGGGGGGMWLDGLRWEIAGERIDVWRAREAVAARTVEDFVSVFSNQVIGRRKKKVEKEERETQLILAVACPYETPRFEDALKSINGHKERVVMDIAELLARAMDL